MDFNQWNDVARVLAILAGVVFGSAAISSACWVWLRKQIFAYGGSALCGAGVVLLGLSIWHSVEFGVGSSGVRFKMQALDEQLNMLNEQAASLNEQYDGAHKILTEASEMLKKASQVREDLRKEVSKAEAAASLSANSAQWTAQLAASNAETSRLLASAVQPMGNTYTPSLTNSANRTSSFADGVARSVGASCQTVFGKAC